MVMREVWESYEAARPQSGLPYESWVAGTAARIGIEDYQVREICAKANQTYLEAVATGVRTHAQQLGGLVGACLVKGISTLAQSMNATKKRVVTNKDGEVVDIIETPDNATRLQAAVQTIKMHGGFPAEQIEVNNRSLIVNLSKDELANEYAALRGSIERLASQLGPEAVAGIGAAEGSAQGKPGTARPLLLDDGMHQNKRRAKQRAVPSVPEQGIPAAGAELSPVRAEPGQGH
jgi:hypothetical protein